MGVDGGNSIYGFDRGMWKNRWYLAAGPSIPFGTKIYIPEFMKTFVVEDRGGAITDNHLDIYMERLEDAREFGRKDMYVFILESDG